MGFGGTGEVRTWAQAPQREQDRHKRGQRNGLHGAWHDCFEAKLSKGKNPNFCSDLDILPACVGLPWKKKLSVPWSLRYLGESHRRSSWRPSPAPPWLLVQREPSLSKCSLRHARAHSQPQQARLRSLPSSSSSSSLLWVDRFFLFIWGTLLSGGLAERHCKHDFLA